MSFNNTFPEWKNEGTPPSEDLRTNGFEGGDKPPAGWLNWLCSLVAKCFSELQEKVTSLLYDTDALKNRVELQDSTFGVVFDEIEKGDQEVIDLMYSNVGTVGSNFEMHKADKLNPHGVTAEQIGLGNVDNTPDSQKNVAFAIESGVGRKVENALTVRFKGGDTEGTDKFTFDGAVSKSINITPERIGAAERDLSNVGDDTFKSKAQTAGAMGAIIVNGISTDGVAYNATVDGFEFEVGKIISFIPNMTTTSKQTTLNINGTGAIRLHQSLSSQTSPMVSANNVNWLSAERPVLLMYHETTNQVGTVTKAWKTVATRTTDEDIYGTIGIEKGGTGATTAEEACENLGALRSETNYYKGTGTYGRDNPTVFTFASVPKSFILGKCFGEFVEIHIFPTDISGEHFFFGKDHRENVANFEVDVSLDGKTISLVGSTSAVQYNDANYIYYYRATY